MERDFDKAGAPAGEKAPARRGHGEKNASVKKGFGGERLPVKRGPSARGGGLAARGLDRECL